MSKTLVNIEVWQCICDKCGREWLSKTERAPKVCPRCKNLKWDRATSGQPAQFSPVLNDTRIEYDADFGA